MVETGNLIGSVEGKTVLMFDDMISTAGTVCEAAKLVKDRGARDVIAAATHPILSGPAVQRLNEAPFSEVIVTNTLPLSDSVNIPKLTVLSMAPLIAQAIRAVFEDGSVASLFDGDN